MLFSCLAHICKAEDNNADTDQPASYRELSYHDLHYFLQRL